MPITLSRPVWVKIIGLTALALMSGTAAGSWDQGSVGLAWTLPLLGGSAFLLAAACPRWAGGSVLVLSAGVLAAHAGLPGLQSADSLGDGLIAASVGGLFAAAGALPGVALGRWFRQGQAFRSGPVRSGQGASGVRQRVSIDGRGGAA